MNTRLLTRRPNAWRPGPYHWAIVCYVAFLVLLVGLRRTNVITACIRHDNLPLLTNCVKLFPSLIHRQDRWGCTPLFFAARDGNLPAFTLLLQHGADPDVEEAKGFTVEQRLGAPAFGKPEVKGAMYELLAEAEREKRRKQPARPTRLAYPGER